MGKAEVEISMLAASEKSQSVQDLEKQGYQIPN